jgi:LytTr DNA-binding domain
MFSNGSSACSLQASQPAVIRFAGSIPVSRSTDKDDAAAVLQTDLEDTSALERRSAYAAESWTAPRLVDCQRNQTSWTMSSASAALLINRERLAECVARLDGLPRRTQLYEARRQRKLERILVRRGWKSVVIGIEDVAVFESENKLVFVRTAEGRFLLSMSMKEIEERVDPEPFCRVHKQAIVRLSLVREIQALAGGQYVAKLRDGYEVQVGRNYAHEFRSRFG